MRALIKLYLKNIIKLNVGENSEKYIGDFFLDIPAENGKIADFWKITGFVQKKVMVVKFKIAPQMQY